MKVKNVEAEIRFKYNEAANSSQAGEDAKDFSGEDGGITNLINKAATGAGLIAQQPELSHLVSTVRQEWDTQM